MSSEINVPDDLKELVNEIIARNNLDSASKITYSNGSELGDGFMTKTIVVDISDGKENLHLFVKYPLNAKNTERIHLNKLYTNETLFYEVIVPAYTDFLKNKNLERTFQYIPKCYGASNNIIVLENLKSQSYQLCDKELIGSDEHIILVFKTYAKFHAISFAYKDQKSEEYQKIVSGVDDIYRENADDEGAKRRVESMRNEINNFLKQLDPVKDKYILDRSKGLADRMTEFNSFMNAVVFENSVLIQGDCWCNNMMFIYQDDKSAPLDIMLIDWQVIRSASPVLCLSYFFYTVAASSKETLKKLDYFLNVYHEELSTEIRKMGSDPEKIYPSSIFQAEWKQFCKFGYMIAHVILKVMLSSKNEVPGFQENNSGEITPAETFPVLQRNEEFIDRLRNLTEHFLLKEFL